jgi:hypothetical protein
MRFACCALHVPKSCSAMPASFLLGHELKKPPCADGLRESAPPRKLTQSQGIGSGRDGPEHLYGGFAVKLIFIWRVPLIWACLQACADRPSRARRQRLAVDRTQNNKRSEVSSPSGASIAPQTCIRSIRQDQNHDAVMRIGGEAPRRRAHSKPRFKDHVQGRVATTSVRHLQFGINSIASCRISSSRQVAGRRRRPPGASPVVTSRQSAIRSLRASATIMVLRVPLRVSAVRLRYHSANRLSF